MDLLKRILLPLAVIMLVEACAPYPYGYNSRREARPSQSTGEQTITSEEQRQIEENRKRLEQESYRNTETGQWNQANNNPSSATKPKYPTASPVPGKPGFVFNPYTHNIVDVKGIASGRLCRDPEDPDPSHKFRVP
jgi:hypothetical protein